MLLYNMKFHFLCPSGLEAWDHRTPDGPGIAGSETCMVEITRRLAMRGHDVVIYGMTFPDTPDDVVETPAGPNVVRWRNIESKIDYEQDGVWWLCRCPAYIDLPGLRTNRGNRQFMLRCDDAHYERPGCPQQLTPERAERFDHILLMSNPQRDDVFFRVYPFLDPTKVSTLGCAIPTERIGTLRAEIVPDHGIRGYPGRDPYQLIWPNSPDRGLEHAIPILQLARKKEPRLHLEVYYGWNGCISASNGDPNHKLIALMRRCTEELDLTNVQYHGRVNKDTLWRGFLGSNIWLYPCNFFECGVCSAMEAQACGAIPITRPWGGLGQMVQNGIFIEGEPSDPKVQREYADAILTVTSRPDWLESFRDGMIERAMQEFTWDRVIDHHERLAGIPKAAVIQTPVDGLTRLTSLTDWTVRCGGEIGNHCLA